MDAKTTEKEMFKAADQALVESGRLVHPKPMTAEERRRLFIEPWRVKYLFHMAYERYKQRKADDDNGMGTGRV